MMFRYALVFCMLGGLVACADDTLVEDGPESAESGSDGSGGQGAEVDGAENNGEIDLSEAALVPCAMKTYRSDGALSREERYGYDMDDRLVSMEMWIYAGASDGTLVHSFTETYVYNTQGQRISKELVNSGELSDGMDSVTIYQHDEEGRLAAIMVERQMQPLFGGEERYDFDGDGLIDELETYTYEDDARITTRVLDVYVDDIVDKRFTYQHDAEGNVIEEEEFNEIDLNADHRTYTYDAQGLMISMSLDRGADGVMDRTEAYTYTHDGDGRLLSKEALINGGRSDFTRHYVYSYICNQ